MLSCAPWRKGAEWSKGLQDMFYYLLKHNELMFYAEVWDKTLSRLLLARPAVRCVYWLENGYLEWQHQLHWECLHQKITTLVISKHAFLSHLPWEGSGQRIHITVASSSFPWQAHHASWIWFLQTGTPPLAIAFTAVNSVELAQNLSLLLLMEENWGGALNKYGASHYSCTDLAWPECANTVAGCFQGFVLAGEERGHIEVFSPPHRPPSLRLKVNSSRKI